MIMPFTDTFRMQFPLVHITIMYSLLKFCVHAICATHKERMDMFDLSPSKVHILSFQVQLKMKCMFHVGTMLLFYILQNITLTKVAYYLKIRCFTEFKDPT
jgi:hypothetical protein